MMDFMMGMKKWISPERKVKEGTCLTELHIHHLRDAHDVIGMQPEDYTPMILVPESSVSSIACFKCCMVSIPDGFTAIVTRFGSDVPGGDINPATGVADGGWDPGFHFFFPCNKVARLVTRQFMIFDTPVRECKTKDNVTVQIDAIITFQVIEPMTFAYGIGPEKLDDLLRASQEEVVRQMAGDTDVVDIYDLFGHEKTTPYVHVMNETFQEYGVKINSFTIRNVRIPPNMAKDFEDLTLYTSQTVEAEMKQESDKLRLNNQEELQKLTEENDNRRMAAVENASTKQAEIRKEVQEVGAQLNKSCAMKGAERIAEVTDIETTCAREIASILSETSYLQVEKRQDMKCKVDKMSADMEGYEQNQMSQGHLEAAAKISEGRKAVAVAEGAAAEAFGARRAQEQELKKIDILDKLANNRHIQVVTSLENNTGLAPGNSLVAQITQQGMEALRMKFAEATSKSATSLDMGKAIAGGLIRPVPPQQEMGGGFSDSSRVLHTLMKSPTPEEMDC